MADEKKLRPEVQELIDYLKETGTGKAKLEAIANVEADNAKDFLAKVEKVVPEGTMAKVKEFLGVAEEKPEPKKAKKEKKEDDKPKEE